MVEKTDNDKSKLEKLIQITRSQPVNSPKRITARVEAYLLQAKLGIREPRKTRQKIDLYLNRLEERFPLGYEWLTGNDEDGQKRILAIRHSVFPPADYHPHDPYRISSKK